MCEHLDKAKGALGAAGQEDGDARERFLRIAEVQAQVSQAASLAQLVRVLGPQFGVMNPVQVPPTPPAGGGWRYAPPYEGLNNAS